MLELELDFINVVSSIGANEISEHVKLKKLLEFAKDFVWQGDNLDLMFEIHCNKACLAVFVRIDVAKPHNEEVN